MQVSREWSNILKLFCKKKVSPRISIPNENISQKRNKMQKFSDIQKVRKCVTSRPALQKILKEVLRMEENVTRWKQDLDKEMKSIRKGNHMGKCIEFF